MVHTHPITHPIARPTPATTARRPGRAIAHVRGLDGLRALALAAVVVFHVQPSRLPGGFTGVDVFFVLSGYLITALLVRERLGTGTIDLRAFYARRARRLVPAAAATVLVTSCAALLVGGDVLVGLVPAIAGAVTGTSNWEQLLLGGGYSAQNRFGLLDNFWSLAVEAQFYLLWPFALVLLVRGARTGVRLTRVAVLTGSSVLLTLALGGAGHLEAAYLATPAHATGLLLGAALAVAAHRDDGARPVPRLAGTARVVVAGASAAAGLTAWAGLLLAPWAGIPAHRPAATVLAALAGTAVVTGCVLGAGRWLDHPVLRRLGQRSYAIYLWHLPLIVLADAAVPPVPGAGALPGRVLAVVAALLIAEVSSHLLERPVRRDGFTATARRPGVRTGIVAAAVTALAVTTLIGCVAPQRTSVQDAVEGSPATSTGTSTGTARSAAPAAVVDRPVVAVGDSVMLASREGLREQFPHVTIDAKESRQLTSAAQVVREQLTAHPDAEVVVLGLGVNGSGGVEDLEAAVSAAGGRRVVLVSVSAPVAWEDSVNQDIAEVAARHGNVAVADWRSQARAHPDLIATDGIHPSTAGGRLYAGAVADALASLG